MSYEAAPATALLATRCACCGRPLLDAASIEAGVGPVCRKKFGYFEIPEATRDAANVLVHEAALDATTNERRVEIATELRALGADVIAAKILDNFIRIAVKVFHKEVVIGRGKYARTLDGLFVTTDYSPAFNDQMKTVVDFRDRSPVFGVEDGEEKFLGWAFKADVAPALWSLFRQHFAGQSIAVDGDVARVIPALAG